MVPILEYVWTSLCHVLWTAPRPDVDKVGTVVVDWIPCESVFPGKDTHSANSFVGDDLDLPTKREGKEVPLGTAEWVCLPPEACTEWVRESGPPDDVVLSVVPVCETMVSSVRTSDLAVWDSVMIDTVMCTCTVVDNPCGVARTVGCWKG